MYDLINDSFSQKYFELQIKLDSLGETSDYWKNHACRLRYLRLGLNILYQEKFNILFPAR